MEKTYAKLFFEIEGHRAVKRRTNWTVRSVDHLKECICHEFGFEQEHYIFEVYDPNVTGYKYYELEELPEATEGQPVRLRIRKNPLDAPPQQASSPQQQAPPQQRQQQASSTVDPHEAKQLVTFMLQLNGAKQSADEFSKPPRLCANRQHFKRVGLEESLIATYAAFAKRLRARREAAADAFVASAAERQNNPLVALQSAPGGGKSFFLDQLAELNEDDLRRYCEGAELVMNEAGSSDVVRELMDILRESIPVCVTYNSGTTWSINVDTNPEEGLAMRILGAYFMKDNFDWDTFI